MAANLAIHGAHNGNLAVEQDGKLVCVIEFERYIDCKNVGFTSFYPMGYLSTVIIDDILEYIKIFYDIHEYDNVLYQDSDFNCLKHIPAKSFTDVTHHCLHHAYHAYGTFYQSDLSKAVIISYDGGAQDGYFNIYYHERGRDMQLLKKVNLDLGSFYGHFGEFMEDIKPSKFGNLVYAGKIMGLQSYGNVREEWVPAIKQHYQYIPWWQNLRERCGELSAKLGLDFNIEKRFGGKDSWDLAATSQKVFEDLAFAEIDDVVKNHPDAAICITGGCALNILMNTKIKEKYNRKTFVAPNSSDCGLAVGMLAANSKPENPWDVTYAGLPVFDRFMLMRYVNGRGGQKVTPQHIAQDLSQNMILGVVQGTSEHGPRALGNRSIICSPIGKDMKDILNAKVKNREWYRPFAPVVRLEDVSEYFEWNEESRWMNFCPKVKENYLEILPSITHVDSTARVQTITNEQNPFIYKLITEFKEITGIGVLLNTSFNVDGKPILSTYADAFKVFDETRLDRLYLDGFYFRK